MEDSSNTAAGTALVKDASERGWSDGGFHLGN
jgi:hypothetical protein